MTVCVQPGEPAANGVFTLGAHGPTRTCTAATGAQTQQQQQQQDTLSGKGRVRWGTDRTADGCWRDLGLAFPIG